MIDAGGIVMIPYLASVDQRRRSSLPAGKGQQVIVTAELLNSGLTVEETARRLGYSETAAFTRAHARWNGQPPSRRKR